MHTNSSILNSGLVVLLLVGLVGCGHSASSPIHDEVDFSQSTEIFSDRPTRAPRKADPEGIVATVNGRTINNQQLQRALNNKVAQIQSRYTPEQIQQMAQRLASESRNDLIRQILIEGEVESEQITVSDEKIDETLANARTILENRGGNWQEFLTKTKVSEEDFREQTRQQLRFKELFDSRVAEPSEPTEEQIAEFFGEQRETFRTPDSIRYRHILVRVEPDADKTAWKIAEERVEELRSLAEEAINFEELARKFSDDESTKENGGLVAPAFRGQLSPALDAVLFEAEVNDILKPVRTPEGFHLIRVEEKLPPRNLELDEVREDITNYIKSLEKQANMAAYFQELTDKAEIVVEGTIKAESSAAESGEPAGG